MPYRGMGSLGVMRPDPSDRYFQDPWVSRRPPTAACPARAKASRDGALQGASRSSCQPLTAASGGGSDRAGTSGLRTRSQLPWTSGGLEGIPPSDFTYQERRPTDARELAPYLSPPPLRILSRRFNREERFIPVPASAPAGFLLASVAVPARGLILTDDHGRRAREPVRQSSTPTPRRSDNINTRHSGPGPHTHAAVPASSDHEPVDDDGYTQTVASPNILAVGTTRADISDQYFPSRYTSPSQPGSADRFAAD